MTAETTDPRHATVPGGKPGKPRGRPKGHPKTGGRAKGTPNKSTVATRDRIMELGDPIEFLSDVMAGKRMTAAQTDDKRGRKTWVYPTLPQRQAAAETLLRKILPDLKATELTGADGEALIPAPFGSSQLPEKVEVARRIAFALAQGVSEKEAKERKPAASRLEPGETENE